MAGFAREPPRADSYASYSSSSDQDQGDGLATSSAIQTGLGDQPSSPNWNNVSSLQSLQQRIEQVVKMSSDLDTSMGFHASQFVDGSDNDSVNSESASNASTSSAHGARAVSCTTDEEELEHRERDEDSTSACNCDDDTFKTKTSMPTDADGSELQNVEEPQKTKSSSSAVISTLKRRWKGVKKAGARGTTAAGKSLSSLHATYLTSAKEPETREDRHSRLGDEWANSIIPSWRKKRKTARVRTLVFRGIPANVRGRVWQCAIGNSLNVSEELFSVLKERAYLGRMEYLRSREILAMADGDVGGSGGKAEALMESERCAHKAIGLDLPRTFPELIFFHAEGSHYEFALRDILEAFMYLKPDVGYSQGMSFLAAVLLLYMDVVEAFSCFVNMLLYKSCFIHFFQMKMPEVRIYLTVHERLLNEEMPQLCTHFKEQAIESDLYMINWVMSLYCQALPLDLVTRIWDLYVLDGDIAIFRAALGILRLFSKRLLKMKFEELAYFLSHIPGNEIEADELLQCIRNVRVVTTRRFRDLFKECQGQHIRNQESLTPNVHPS